MKTTPSRNVACRRRHRKEDWEKGERRGRASWRVRTIKVLFKGCGVEKKSSSALQGPKKKSRKKGEEEKGKRNWRKGCEGGGREGGKRTRVCLGRVEPRATSGSRDWCDPKGRSRREKERLRPKT